MSELENMLDTLNKSWDDIAVFFILFACVGMLISLFIYFFFGFFTWVIPLVLGIWAGIVIFRINHLEFRNY